jgi:hypothetical protein
MDGRPRYYGAFMLGPVSADATIIPIYLFPYPMPCLYIRDSPFEYTLPYFFF